MKNYYRVIIAGGGVCGIHLGFYLKRFGIDDFIIFEAERIGGILNLACLVENIPFIRPISGKSLVRKLEYIVKKHKINLVYEMVKEVNKHNDLFWIKTDKGEYFSKYFILATGLLPVIPPFLRKYKDEVIGFQKNLLKIKNKKVAIIGSGDLAFDHSLILSKTNNRVFIFTRRIKAIDILVERVKSKSNISVLENSKIVKVEKKDNSFIIEYILNGKKKKDSFDIILCCCGRRKGFYGINNIGKIFKDRFFEAGDLKNYKSRYIINAISDALNIAMKIKEREDEGYCKSR